MAQPWAFPVVDQQCGILGIGGMAGLGFGLAGIASAAGLVVFPAGQKYLAAARIRRMRKAAAVGSLSDQRAWACYLAVS